MPRNRQRWMSRTVQDNVTGGLAGNSISGFPKHPDRFVSGDVCESCHLGRDLYGVHLAVANRQILSGVFQALEIACYRIRDVR